MKFKINHKREVCLTCLFLIPTLLLPYVVSAEIEINSTLEDNLVILLDYSGSTIPFREYIESNAIYSIHNIEAYSNVSVVVYGGYIKNSNVYSADTQDNRTILEGFVRNITGKEGDAARDNISDGFVEARKILYNSTGTKQIVLISDGNVDGKTNGKIDNVLLKELVKDLKKNNVTINLYQVIDTNISQTLKATWVREPYRDLSDKINTEVVVLNRGERIRFFKPKSQTTVVSVSSKIANSSQLAAPNVDILSEGDEYLNEFSKDGETSSVISIMQYDRRDSLSEIYSTTSFSEVHFYSYCNQTCIVIPFDIEQRKFFNEITLKDVFLSENAIKLVKSGNVTGTAYTFSIGADYLCENYGSDVLREQSMNLGGEVAPLIKPESAKPIKMLRNFNVISKVNPGALVVSAGCKAVSNEEGEVLNKISEGRNYINYLESGFAYYNIVNEFQNYNRETKQEIIEAKNNILVQIHAPIQSISNLLISPFIKIIDNCLNNKCQGDFSIDKTNMEIFDEKLALITNNYAQLSNQNYEPEIEMAISRINYKSEESRAYINDAANELSEINSQIPNAVIEAFSNFIEEPETDYSMARLRQTKADDYFNKAKENQSVYKFNSANQNSNYSIAQSREGMVFANMENSKERHLKIWVWVLGAITAIFLTFIAINKLCSPKIIR